MIEELLTRIAVALEAQVTLISGGLGAPQTGPGETTPPADPTPAPAATTGKGKGKTTAPAKFQEKPAETPKAEPTPEPEPEPEQEEAGPSVEDVRAAYLVLTKATSAKRAKEVFDAYKEQVGKADSAAMTAVERQEMIEQFQAAAI